MIRNSGVFSPRTTRSSSSARQAASLSPPMFFTTSSTFWPSRRTPRTTSSEIDVAFLSSRTRTTVPSRISRTMSSVARGRFDQVPNPSSPSATPGSPCPCRQHPEQRRERPADPAGVGAGEIGSGDQRLHLPGHAGISGQHLALPLASPPVRTTDPRPRHCDLDRSERAAEPALAVTVPVTRRRRRCRPLLQWHRPGRFCRSRSRLAQSPFVAPPTQRGGQLLLDQPLDKAADLLPNARLDRVEPSLPEKQRRVALHELRTP